MRTLTQLIVTFALGLSVTSNAYGLAEQTGDHGFNISHGVEIAASSDAVFKTIFEIDRWWHPDHRWYADGVLSIDPRPFGCFCEADPSGTGPVRHIGMITRIDPNAGVTFLAALGPLQLPPTIANGLLIFNIQEKSSGVELSAVYQVRGYHPNGLSQVWMNPVHEVLKLQLERLKRLIETGTP